MWSLGNVTQPERVVNGMRGLAAVDDVTIFVATNNSCPTYELFAV